LCASVNEAIEACLAAGTMGATCVMTNMPEYGQAAGLRRKFPNCSLGLHWNVTQGEPVLGAAAVPSLVDDRGRFSTSLRRRWLLGKVNRAELRAELTAQHGRLRAAAGLPDFWNTHQNVHVFPGLFQFFAAVSRELGMRAMRSHERVTVPAEGSLAGYHARHPAYWLKGKVIRGWSNRERARGMLLPDGRLYLPGYQAGAFSLPVLLERPDFPSAGIAELVIHPAKRLDSELLGGLTDSRLREYKMFSDDRLASQVRRAGVDLVGFDALDRAQASRGREQAA
jgi:predicted glycoside hydrolase/deacetylase ChbG (UPF0249 family)